ncbi:MAG: helix-turn-helix domain-containing protein [Candidatus Electrothrix scaldis]|nr:MAG: helix-turn-helix domain-containing protein [Candidatus Electrothrix sp. GW3-3]
MSRHQTSSSQSTIAINGPKIKELRNANSLTQLYISESLGVAVDTISRWENNRSPNIMVENAQKLAALLEVPIEEISCPGPEISKQKGEAEAKSIWTTWLLPTFLLLIFLTIVLYLIINPPRIIIELKDEGLIIKISSVTEKRDKVERNPLRTTEIGTV